MDNANNVDNAEHDEVLMLLGLQKPGGVFQSITDLSTALRGLSSATDAKAAIVLVEDSLERIKNEFKADVLLAAALALEHAALNDRVAYDDLMAMAADKRHAADRLRGPALAACPFCGKDEVYPVQLMSSCYVECGYCNVEGPVAGTIEEAAAFWNERHSSSQPAAAGTVKHAELYSVLKELYDAITDYGMGCECRPEPENEGHICSLCRAKLSLQVNSDPDCSES